MKTIGLLKNTIQEYVWGSYTAIAELLGNESPSDVPQAELWMGAHPRAPSMVDYDGRWVSMLELIEQHPEEILGQQVVEKFGNRLPYLFKVLAAAKPLSIQAHPNRIQAQKGFANENRRGIAFDAADRNYKDDNHKPECICALTPFWGLNGFRKIHEIIALMRKTCPQGLEDDIIHLQKNPDSQGLKGFFYALMTLEPRRKMQIIDEALENAHKRSQQDHIFKWMTHIHFEYPNDIGMLAPAFLNLICLEPGQALFLEAGELHAYLDGVGIELMANSDNVLRGGLTPKHVDVPELLNVLKFKERDINILSKQSVNACEQIYTSKAEEFVLAVITVAKNETYSNPSHRSIETVLCTEGKATLTDVEHNYSLVLYKGSSAIIPAAVKKYTIDGEATLYKASVPV